MRSDKNLNQDVLKSRQSGTSGWLSNLAALANSRRYEAINASILMAYASVIVGGFAAFKEIPFTSWKAILLVGIPWLIALIALVSTQLCWRGKVLTAVELLLGFFLAGTVGVVLLAQGLGIILAVASFVVISFVGLQAFPIRQALVVILAGGLFGGLVYWLDLRGPAGRLTIEIPFQVLALFIAGLVLSAYLLFLVQSFRHFKLMAKLVAPFVLVALISTGALAMYNYFTTRASLNQAANLALQASAVQTASTVQAFLENTTKNLALEATLPAFVDYLSLPADQRRGHPLETEAASFLATLQARGYVLSYSLLDTTGKVWLDTGTPIQATDRLPKNLDLDITEPGFLNRVLITGQPEVTPVIFEPETNIPSLYFVARVSDRTEVPLGFLVSRYHASYLQSFIALSNNIAGERSFAVLTDENNLRLAQGVAPDTLYKFVSPIDQSILVKLILTRRAPNLPLTELTTDFPDFSTGLSNVGSTPYFSARETGTGGELSSMASTTIPGQRWTVTFLQPQTVFLAPVERQTRTTILIALSVAIFMALAATIIGQVISHPITRLTSLTEQAAAGNLYLTVSYESRDEIGTLARAFNAMITQLRLIMERLEQRVTERTGELARAMDQSRRHAAQLELIADVARVIASVRDLDLLLPIVTQTISERFGYYHVGVFLLDPNKEYAVLQAANSPGGQRMLARGHRLPVGQVGIIGYVMAHGEPRIALDVGKDAVFFDNPDLPETRSEVGLPLKSGDQVIGALDVQSTAVAAFTNEDVALLSTLADQVAIAIDNARLFSDTRRALLELQSLQRQYLSDQWTKLVTERQMVGYQYSSGKLTSILVNHNGEEPIPKEILPQDLWDTLEQQGFALTPTSPDRGLPIVSPESTIVAGNLFVPISLRGQVIGLINLQEVDPQHLWTDEEINLVKSVAEQVGLALENARLLEETQKRAEREALVAQITTKIRASNDPQTILQTAVQELRQTLGARTVRVVIPSSGSENPSLGDHRKESNG